ncbi:TVP38/TMEM64 family protein [Paenisporosarcina antarctica]|uniref:TVP38/TMEM64 family membrane protein n=1 Tax=Paenisporosarcina antarctica TaxID=417367 RepID=A0A4V1ANC4_9BACL|nr:TVP38/TMEM64 family protein [Paenisporosarcina antarctica]QBP42285.1 TVP38/TMEM64 family protein [Paenisporosarcina antarctica]
MKKRTFWQEWQKIILFVGFAISCLIVLYAFDVIGKIDIEAASDYVRELGIWGMLLYVIVYTIRPLFFFPATLLTLFGGYTFGPFLGTALDIVGAGSGAVLAFLVARYLGREKIEKFVKGKKIERFDQSIQNNGFIVVLYLRLIPLIPFDSINYSLGLSSIKLKSYMAATYLGIIPGAFVLNYIGSSLRTMDSKLWIAVALYGVMVLLPFLVKKFKGTTQIHLEKEPVK